MTISEITTRLDEKAGRMAELAERIKAVEFDISGIEQQMDISVKKGAPDCAIDLLRQKRDKEDELQVLRQVMENIRATSAITPVDIKETWGQRSSEFHSEIFDTALPELKEAFARYVRAAETIYHLRQKAHLEAKQLDAMARQENAQVYLDNPFDGLELTTGYWPGKTYLVLLNSVSVPILHDVSIGL